MNPFRRAFQRLLDARSPKRPTHVIPLGLSCRVAYQVRTYFASQTAHPFDWWVTPLDGLTSYLSDPDPDRVFGEGALAEAWSGGHVTTIVAPELGFQLYHEFPRQDVGLPSRVVASGWRLHVAEARARHSRRLERLLALDRPGERLLFVRDRLDADGGRSCRSPTETIARLSHTLASRWRQCDVELLLLNVPLPPQLALPGGIVVRRIDFEDVPGAPPESWRGDPARWADAFSRAGFARRKEANGAGAPVGPPD